MVSSKLKFNKEAQPVQGYLMKNSEGFEEGVVEGLINHLIRKAQDPANLSWGLLLVLSHPTPQFDVN